MDSKVLIKKFVEDLEVRQRSEHTINSYKRFVQEMFTVEGYENIDDITLQLYDSYPNALQEYREKLGMKPLSIASIQIRMNAIRTFLNSLDRLGLYENNYHVHMHIPRGKKEVREHYAPTKEEVINMIKVSMDYYPTMGYRNNLIIRVMIQAGLRVSEVSSITPSNLTGHSIKLTGKGNKQREVYINSVLAKDLDDYINKERQKLIYQKIDISNFENQPIFRSNVGGSLSTGSIQNLIDDISKNKKINNPRITPHTLRSYWITELVRAGVDLDVIAEMAGHSSIETTRSYVSYINDERFSQAVQATYDEAYNVR